MTTKVDVQVRSLHLTDQIKAHIERRAGRLDRYLPAIEVADVELTYHASVRSANDRSVAQVTLRGKGLVLRTEERSAEILTAFDAAIEKLRKQIERYKGRHVRGRGGEASAADDESDLDSADETDRLPPIIARRKQFRILPMDALEAVEQMNLLGHETFFVFYNAETSRINVLYRRRDGTYGLIEPEIG